MSFQYAAYLGKKKIVCLERNNLGTAYLPFALSFQTILTLERILGDSCQQILISDCISFFIKVTYDRNLREAVGKKQSGANIWEVWRRGKL